MRFLTRRPLFLGSLIVASWSLPGCSDEAGLDTRPTAELSKPYPPDPKARDNFGKMTKRAGAAKQAH